MCAERETREFRGDGKPTNTDGPIINNLPKCQMWIGGDDHRKTKTTMAH